MLMLAVFSIAPITVMSERGPFRHQRTLIATAARFWFTFPSYPSLADIVRMTVETCPAQNVRWINVISIKYFQYAGDLLF